MTTLLGLLAFEVIWFLPFQKVFKIAHFSPSYAYLALIPFLGPFICIWILAAKPWPLKTRMVRSTSL